MSLQRSLLGASRAFQAIQASPRLSPLSQRQYQRGSAPIHPSRGAPAAAAASAADGPSTSGSRSSSSSGGSPAAPQAFVGLERLISESLGGGMPGGDWREVEGSWVLYPPPAFGQPRCLVHFVGGAFVGAAPQLAYKPLLEALASRGALIVATPYDTSFNHIRCADEIYFKLSRCLKSLGPSAISLPTYGLGHSLGSLMHLLVASRYLVERRGNVLMSFNNRPATDAIPFLSPFIAPSARALGPLLAQLATSPLRSGVEQWVDILKGLSPASVRQVIPVLEQLVPIYLDVAKGTQEFQPPPEEARALIRSGYTVARNLLLRFAGDSIDETPALTSTLQSSAVGSSLELTVKTLPGDHVRPLTQDLARFSPDLARAANQAVAQGESFLGQLGALAAQAGLPEQAQEQLTGLARAATGVASAIGEAVSSQEAGQNIEALANEIGGWMGLEQKCSSDGSRAPLILPERVVPPPQ